MDLWKIPWPGCIRKKTIAWTGEPFNVLGINISLNQLEDNYCELLDKAKSILLSWTHRNLSLMGKVLLINTLMASHFIYKMTVLPAMSYKLIKQFESIFNDFLWNGKKAKIPLYILKANLGSGGAKLINLAARDSAIKITWIKILDSDPKCANLAYSFLSPVLQRDIWLCNISPTEISKIMKKNSNPFWFDVLSAWSKQHYQGNELNASTFLWYNSLVRIDNSPFLWVLPYKRGLMFCDQLYNNGDLISARTAWTSFSLDVMQFNAVISAIPRAWKQNAKEGVPRRLSMRDEILRTKNISKMIY